MLSSEPRLNPVEFVTIKERQDPLSRAVRIATTAKDVFSIGEAVVDGVVLYRHAVGIRALVGAP